MKHALNEIMQMFHVNIVACQASEGLFKYLQSQLRSVYSLACNQLYHSLKVLSLFSMNTPNNIIFD